MTPDKEQTQQGEPQIDELYLELAKEKHEHVFKGSYGKDDLKQLHAYCGDCGEEMPWPESKPHSPIERWEKDLMAIVEKEYDMVGGQFVGHKVEFHYLKLVEFISHTLDDRKAKLKEGVEGLGDDYVKCNFCHKPMFEPEHKAVWDGNVECSKSTQKITMNSEYDLASNGMKKHILDSILQLIDKIL